MTAPGHDLGKVPIPESQVNVLRLSMWRGGHCQLDLRPVTSHRQRFASHQFDRWPVPTEEARCVVEIVRLHANTAGLSAGSVRYLKVKIEADCFRIGIDRLIISAHLVSPPFCVAHIRFMILIFVGRDYGALEGVNLVVFGAFARARGTPVPATFQRASHSRLFLPTGFQLPAPTHPTPLYARPLPWGRSTRQKAWARPQCRKRTVHGQGDRKSSGPFKGPHRMVRHRENFSRQGNLRCPFFSKSKGRKRRVTRNSRALLTSIKSKRKAKNQ
jgi:hypothetical protein